MTITGDNQIEFVHYMLDKIRQITWDVELYGPCQNKEFMALIRKITGEIEEAHRLVGVKE